MLDKLTMWWLIVVGSIVGTAAIMGLMVASIQKPVFGIFVVVFSLTGFSAIYQAQK